MPFGWAAAIGGAATVAGAYMQSSAADDAANSQAASSADAIGEQRRQYNQTRGDYREQYDQTRADQRPYMLAGRDALAQFQSGIDTPLDASGVQMDPGYAFARGQGQEAIDRMSAASGGRLSGASLKAASQYNTDYATTKYDGAYNRLNQARGDRLNRLAALAGIGQTSTQQTGANGLSMAQGLGAFGNSSAQGISGNMTAQGNASGAGQLAQGNIWGSAGNQLASLYGRNQSAFPASSATPVYDGGYSIGQGSAYGGNRAGL